MLDRFWSKVTITDDCWEWQRHRNRGGYGTYSVGKKKILAHRWSYEQAFGPIPQNHKVLHKCDNPPCVRPEHLFVGTQADNIKDMIQKGRRAVKWLDQCKRGHIFSPENTFIDRKNIRHCATCRREARRIRYEQDKASGKNVRYMQAYRKMKQQRYGR